jgi:hypothetical protein
LRSTVVLTALILFAASISAGASGTKTANAEKNPAVSIEIPKAFVTQALKGLKTKVPNCNKKSWINGIRFLKAETWDYQWRLERSFSPGRKLHRRLSCSFLRWAHSRWEKKFQNAQLSYALWFKRTYAKWDCIHRHEASWFGDNNPTYDGGLQMDRGFQNTYGSEFVRAWGNASNWPVWSQLRAAERAYHGYHGYAARGFTPWPNTARMCGQL